MRKKDKYFKSIPINRLIELARKGLIYENTIDEFTKVTNENYKLKTLISELEIGKSYCKFDVFCSDKITGSCFPKDGDFCQICEHNNSLSTELSKDHMRVIFEQSRSTKHTFIDWYNFNYVNINK